MIDKFISKWIFFVHDIAKIIFNIYFKLLLSVNFKYLIKCIFFTIKLQKYMNLNLIIINIQELVLNDQ